MFNLLVALAIIVRLILMPISVHSDLFFINYFPNLFFTKKVIDASFYINQNLPRKNISYYPPLTYYTFAFFQYFYHFFSDSFSLWMTNLYNLWAINFQGQAAGYIKAAPNPHLYKDIFLAKFPYLIFDLGIILVLLRFIKKRLLSKSVVLIWLFNPVSIYTAYIMGQYELIPTFFVLSGFLLLRKNANLGILLLGIAAAYKNYAFLFILPTVLIYGNSWKERFKLFIISISPYFISLLPSLITNSKEAVFYLFPKVYLHYRKPLGGWSLYSQTIKYIILAAFYIIVLVITTALKFKDKWHSSLGISLVSILLVYAIAPRISFHYLLWAAPLIILWFRNTKIITIVFVIQAISLASYKLLANHLQVGLFAPLNPDYFSNIPTINSFIDRIIPYRIISSIGFFIFLFFNLYLVAKIFSDLIFKSEIQITLQTQKK